jgi:catechol 2,3-dioxygenase
MVHPKRVGHVVLNVKDVEISTKFYTDVIGFQIALQKENATFLTCGTVHHDLALFKCGQSFRLDGGVGLNHIALQVEDFDMLTEYHHSLEIHNVKIDRTTDHGMTSSIYLTDPDGNGIELFCNNQATSEEGLEIMRSPERENKELAFPHLNSF